MPLLVLLSTILAQAAVAPSPAETEIERGRLLIRELYEEKALELLEPHLEDGELPAPLRARALVYAGIAHMNLGDEARAKTTFARALDVDIGAVLPEWVSRKVRVAFGAELERAMAARQPPPPPRPTTRAGRHGWVGPTLLAGAAVSAAFSVLGFVRWSDAWERHTSWDPQSPPVSTDLQQIYDGGRRWHDAAWGLAAAGATLILAALLWWLVPG